MRLASVVVVCACASAGDPPGGPPDRVPPVVTAVIPDSGSVVTPPREATIVFSEVIQERTVGQPSDITGAVILSPTTGPERVTWHRDRVTVRPKNGFRPDRIYHIELLPVIVDLRTNRMRAGRTIVFSTGPPIPDAAIEGTVVDWVAGRPAMRALVEAVLMPDSLVYRSIADSGGVFHISQLPPGQYRVYGVMDSNNDRRRGARETYDSVSVELTDGSAPPLELYAFVRDTTGPRLRQVEVLDSITVKLTFDRPLDPTLPLDTSMITVATLADSTTPLPVAAILTQKGLDSLRPQAAERIHVQPDSLRALPPDTTRRVIPDTTRRVLPDTSRRVRPDTSRRPGPVGVAGGRRPPLDSTRAEKMLARRPPPTDVRIIRLEEPLIPDTRYVIYLRDVRSLSGNVNSPRGQVRAPRPVAPAPGRPAPAPPDSTARDSSVTPRDSTVTPRDTTRIPPRRP